MKVQCAKSLIAQPSTGRVEIRTSSPSPRHPSTARHVQWATPDESSPSPRDEGVGRGAALRRRQVDNCGRIRWYETVVSNFPHHLHASGSALQSMPDLQQHTLRIFLPLMIPKTQHFNIALGKKLLSILIAFPARRHPVLKAIQLHRKSRQRTIEVEVISPHRMLSAKLEAGKPSSPQRPP